MLTTYSKLLRRTFIAVGATLLAGASLPAVSQTVTLSGATGNSCTYSQMTVQPNGQITVSCSGGGTSDPFADNFSVTMTAAPTAAGTLGTSARRCNVRYTETILDRRNYRGF